MKRKTKTKIIVIIIVMISVIAMITGIFLKFEIDDALILNGVIIAVISGLITMIIADSGHW